MIKIEKHELDILDISEEHKEYLWQTESVMVCNGETETEYYIEKNEKENCEMLLMKDGKNKPKRVI